MRNLFTLPTDTGGFSSLSWLRPFMLFSMFFFGICGSFFLPGCSPDYDTAPDNCDGQYELPPPVPNCAISDAISLQIGDVTTIPLGEKSGVKYKYLLYLRNNYYKTLFENSIWIDDLTGGVRLNSLILDFVVFKRNCYEVVSTDSESGSQSTSTVCKCSTFEMPRVQSIKITAINPLDDAQRQVIGEVTQNTLNSSGRLSFQIPTSLPDFKPWFSIVPGKDLQPMEIEIVYASAVQEAIDMRLYVDFCLIK